MWGGCAHTCACLGAGGRKAAMGGRPRVKGEEEANRGAGSLKTNFSSLLNVTQGHSQEKRWKRGWR